MHLPVSYSMQYSINANIHHLIRYPSDSNLRGSRRSSMDRFFRFMQKPCHSLNVGFSILSIIQSSRICFLPRKCRFLWHEWKVRRAASVRSVRQEGRRTGILSQSVSQSVPQSIGASIERARRQAQRRRGVDVAFLEAATTSSYNRKWWKNLCQRH